MEELESLVRELTAPLKGQYPRPWITNFDFSTFPTVFIVGANPATAISEACAGGHDGFVDALFNRNGRRIREVYRCERARLGKAESPTRRNLDAFVERFRGAGCEDILETNVVCYGTPMSVDLRAAEHAGGLKRGTQVFKRLMDAVAPRAVIVHGVGARKRFSKLFDVTLPEEPAGPAEPLASCDVRLKGAHSNFHTTVYTIPSLALPQWNHWAEWAPMLLDRIVEDVASH